MTDPLSASWLPDDNIFSYHLISKAFSGYIIEVTPVVVFQFQQRSDFLMHFLHKLLNEATVNQPCQVHTQFYNVFSRLVYFNLLTIT